jgi:hypothetical protein
MKFFALALTQRQGGAIMANEKECLYCGTKFPAKGKKKYCTYRCGTLYNQMLTRRKYEPRICTVCGEEVQIMQNKETGVRFSAPLKTRTKTTAATVVNSKGYTYDYTMYLQGGGYNSYSRYMKHHGCSNCALTSILNATCPELKDYTPDRVVAEIQYNVFGSKAFWKNYKKDRENGSMQVTLYGMTKIFDTVSHVRRHFDIDSANVRKTAFFDVFVPDDAAVSQSGQNSELAGYIVAFDIGAGISFSKADLLGKLQRVIKIGVVFGHF